MAFDFKVKAHYSKFLFFEFYFMGFFITGNVNNIKCMLIFPSSSYIDSDMTKEPTNLEIIKKKKVKK